MRPGITGGGTDGESEDEDRYAEDEDDHDVSILFPIRPQAGGPTAP